MKAYNIDLNLEFEVEKADKYVLRVIPDAQYMVKEEFGTMTFAPDVNGDFMINKELYKLVGTNRYSELVEHFRDDHENLVNYMEFINKKGVLKGTNKGIEIEITELNNVLFDYQKAIVKKALHKKRFCLFESCGMGKTLQQLEWSYQVVKYTNRPVLIIAPLGVTSQTAYEEAPLLGYEVEIIKKDTVIDKGIYITNYEQLDHVDTSVFVGVVLDESSILKNFTGKMRTKLTDDFRETEYKLCCTATPAPNDLMELLNHADFLGITTTAKALATYFINDMKTGSYRLKGHATKDFYRWCSTWSVNVESPQDLGFKADYYQLPELKEETVIIDIDEIDYNFEDGLFRNIGTSATSFHKEKHRTADSFVFGYFALIMKGAMNACGVAVNLIGTGGTVFVLVMLTGSKANSSSLTSLTFPVVNIPGLQNIPVIGTILSGQNMVTYIGWVIVALTSWMLGLGILLQVIMPPIIMVAGALMGLMLGMMLPVVFVPVMGFIARLGEPQRAGGQSRKAADM